jgi:hypothetical protein
VDTTVGFVVLQLNPDQPPFMALVIVPEAAVHPEKI